MEKHEQNMNNMMQNMNDMVWMKKVCVDGLATCWVHEPRKVTWELEWYTQEFGSNLTKLNEDSWVVSVLGTNKIRFSFYGTCFDNNQSVEYMKGGKNTS